MLTKEQIASGLVLARDAGACIGNLNKAQEFFATGQFDKVEEICRCACWWLNSRGIHYVPTDGVAALYYKNGQQRVEFTLMAGESHGLSKSWHANGTPRDEYTCVHGKPHGLYKSWKENGEPKEECIFKDGVKG